MYAFQSISVSALSRVSSNRPDSSEKSFNGCAKRSSKSLLTGDFPYDKGTEDSVCDEQDGGQPLRVFWICGEINASMVEVHFMLAMGWENQEEAPERELAVDHFKLIRTGLSGEICTSEVFATFALACSKPDLRSVSTSFLIA